MEDCSYIQEKLLIQYSIALIVLIMYILHFQKQISDLKNTTRNSNEKNRRLRKTNQ